MILSEHRKDVRCIEAIEVIYKYGALAEPLSVELAPKSLAPACVGDSKMKSVLEYAVPVFCSNIVTKRRLD